MFAFCKKDLLHGDFTRQLTITACEEKKVDHAYQMTRTKASSAHYVANQAVVTLVNADGYRMDLTMNVSDRDIAYRYSLPRGKDNNPKCAVIYSEASSFNFPQHTTTFICPQSKSYWLTSEKPTLSPAVIAMFVANSRTEFSPNK